MIRKYHNHKLQTTPWHREEEPLNHHATPGRQRRQPWDIKSPTYNDDVVAVNIKLEERLNNIEGAYFGITGVSGIPLIFLE